MKFITIGTDKQTASRQLALAKHILPSHAVGDDRALVAGQDAVEGDFGSGISQGIGIGIGLILVGFVASKISRS